MNRFKKFIFNTFLLLISSLLFRIVGLVFNIYVSNKIGSEALGIFSLVMSVYMFGITFACSGINIATTKVVAEELSLSGKSRAKSVGSKCIIISLITGILASILFFIFSDFITQVCMHNKINVKVIYLICIALPLISMSSAINGYFSGLRKIIKNVSSKFLEQAVKIISTAFLFSILLPKGLNYACYSLILGDVISEIFSFTYIFILYKFDNKLVTKNKSTNSNNAKRILSISLPIALTSYIRSGLSTIKQLLIPYSIEKSGLDCSSTFSKLGIINGMAMPIIMFGGIFITSFSELLIPEFSRYYAKGNLKRAKSITKFLLIITTLVCTCFSVILFVCSKKLGMFIYNNFEVAFYIKLLSPLFVLIYIDNVIDNILKGLNKQVSIMVINIIDLFISVIFIYFFVPIFGVYRLYFFSFFK